MENLEVEYRINEQGMIPEYLKRPDSASKKIRSLSSDNIDSMTSNQGTQNLILNDKENI